MRILLLEDDPQLGEAVRDHLASLGHAVDWLRTLADARHAVHVAHYDLLLLDQRLPDGSGRTLLRSVRQGANAVPVIIITAQDQIAARIEGLNDGADDYLTKPFDLNELMARIVAVERRYASRSSADPLVQWGTLQVDTARRQLRVEGRPVDLTAREWAVLECLLRHPQRVTSRERLEQSLYAFDASVESNTVEVYISRLRKKIGRDAIITLRGLGYRMGGAA